MEWLLVVLEDNIQVVSEDAEGKDGSGECVAAQTRIPARKLRKELVMVFLRAESASFVRFVGCLPLVLGRPLCRVWCVELRADGLSPCCAAILISGQTVYRALPKYMRLTSKRSD